MAKRKRIADMEPGVDVFISNQDKWTPAKDMGLCDGRTWCRRVDTLNTNIRQIFRSALVFEIIGRIGSDGKYEEVEG